MHDFGLNDLLWIGAGLIVVILFSLGVPGAIFNRIAPGIRAALDPDYYNMLSRLHQEIDREDSQNGENHLATTTLQNDNNVIAITQNERNELLLQGKAQALATMVQAKKVTETDGIFLVFGVKPSSTSQKYQAARKALRDELAKLQGPQFLDLNEKKQAV